MKKRMVSRETSWYGQERARAKKRVLFYAVLLCSVAAGWFLFDPISDILLNTEKNIQSGTDSGAQISSSSPVDEQNKEPAPSEQDTRPTVENVYMLRAEDIDTPEKLGSTIELLRNRAATGVVLPIKDDQGAVLAKLSDTQGAAGYDIASVSQKLKENKLLVYGMIYAYEDRSYTLIDRDSAVKYMDSNVIWLDNYADQGGRSWIDPFSAKAQEYILGMVESASKYCDAVLLSSVQFPRGQALNKATFGGGLDARTPVLKEFLLKAVDTAKRAGAELYPVFSAYELLEQTGSYYGKSPKELLTMDYILEVDMADFSHGVIVGDTSITAASTLDSVLEAIAAEKEPSAVLGRLPKDYGGSKIGFLENL